MPTPFSSPRCSADFRRSRRRHLYDRAKPREAGAYTVGCCPSETNRSEPEARRRDHRANRSCGASFADESLRIEQADQASKAQFRIGLPIYRQLILLADEASSATGATPLKEPRHVVDPISGARAPVASTVDRDCQSFLRMHGQRRSNMNEVARADRRLGHEILASWKQWIHCSKFIISQISIA